MVGFFSLLLRSIHFYYLCKLNLKNIYLSIAFYSFYCYSEDSKNFVALFKADSSFISFYILPLALLNMGKNVTCPDDSLANPSMFLFKENFEREDD